MRLVVERAEDERGPCADLAHRPNAGSRNSFWFRLI